VRALREAVEVAEAKVKESSAEKLAES